MFQFVHLPIMRVLLEREFFGCTGGAFPFDVEVRIDILSLFFD